MLLRMRTMVHNCILLLYCLLLWRIAADEPKLRQVHVITRHGARFPLTKHAATLKEGTSGALTPRGEKQMYDLGVWLSTRYSQIENDFLTWYNPEKVYLSSSALDRTITSANSLALGLFADWPSRDPTGERLIMHNFPAFPANIPVYSREIKNDVTIRSYDKCPALLDNLQKLYASPEWHELEESSEHLRIKLGDIMGQPPVPLNDVLNVYDAIMVVKTECTDTAVTATCQELDLNLKDALSDEEWLILQNLVHTIEFSKYSSPEAAEMVGNNLLHQILRRMESSDQQDIESQDGGASFYLYSAHYPTILGMFSALSESPEGQLSAMPGYASAIVIELYKDESSNNFVKILYRSGISLEESESGKVYAFDETCPLERLCPLSTLQAKIQSNWSEEQWCGVCQNEVADICLSREIEALYKSQSCGNDPKRPALAGFLSGLAITILCCTVFGYWRGRRTAKTRNTQGGVPDAGDKPSTACSEAPVV